MYVIYVYLLNDFCYVLLGKYLKYFIYIKGVYFDENCDIFI